MSDCLAYDVSKAGLDMVTKQYALELGPNQIRVNSVNPTVVLTDMGIEHWSELTKAAKMKSLIPMGRFCEVQECIDPILFLLSDHSTMVNVSLNVDSVPYSNIQVIDDYNFKMKGSPSPIHDTCYFLNRTFTKGQHWKDVCRFDCDCVDPGANQARCHDVCVHFSNVPAHCDLATHPGQCCPSLDCHTVTSTGPNPVSTGATARCRDVLSTCNYYPDSSCQSSFVPWARHNCPLRCGLCPGETQPCVDSISYCSQYDLNKVCINNQGWAREHCRFSCNLCKQSG